MKIWNINQWKKLIARQLIDWGYALDPILKYWRSFDTHITTNFTVGDVLHHDYQRIPEDEKIQENLINLTKEVQKLYDSSPFKFKITSGYMSENVAQKFGIPQHSVRTKGRLVSINPVASLTSYSMAEKYQAIKKHILAHWAGRVQYDDNRCFIQLMYSENPQGYFVGYSKEEVTDRQQWNRAEDLSIGYPIMTKEI